MVSCLSSVKDVIFPLAGFALGEVHWTHLTRDEVDILTLVRGLENREGTNNCFLNVVIQALWHLRAFREAFLEIDPQVFVLASAYAYADASHLTGMLQHLRQCATSGSKQLLEQIIKNVFLQKTEQE